MPKPPTIAGLSTDNAALTEERNSLRLTVARLEAADVTMRRELGLLLNGFIRSSSPFTYDKKEEIPTWMEIAFRIGELKADANYSRTIAAREELKRENEELRAKLVAKESA